jgi:GntR family transcriptional regulator
VTVNPESPKPPYLQVADALRDDIVSSRIKPGGKVPSTRQLTERFKVSGMTAQSAVRVLRDEGWIFTTQRGSFVSEQQPDPAAHGEGTDQFRAISQHLDSVNATVQQLAERLEALETEFRAAQRSSQKPAK